VEHTVSDLRSKKLAYLMYEKIVEMMCQSLSERQLDLGKSFSLIGNSCHSAQS